MPKTEPSTRIDGFANNERWRSRLVSIHTQLTEQNIYFYLIHHTKEKNSFYFVGKREHSLNFHCHIICITKKYEWDEYLRVEIGRNLLQKCHNEKKFRWRVIFIALAITAFCPHQKSFVLLDIKMFPNIFYVYILSHTLSQIYIFISEKKKTSRRFKVVEQVPLLPNSLTLYIAHIVDRRKSHLNSAIQADFCRKCENILIAFFTSLPN